MQKVSVLPASDHLVLWVGDVSQGMLNAYLEENSPFGEDGPRSLFAAEIAHWYDPHYVEAYEGPTPTDIGVLLTGYGYGDQEGDEMLMEEARTKCAGFTPFRSFLILWNYRLVDDASAPICGGGLRCVGCWEHPYPYGV